MEKNSENSYIDYLVNKKFDRTEIDWKFISEESKASIEEIAPKLEEFLKSHTDFDNYTTEEKDKHFNEAIELHESYKSSIKNAKCKLELQGREILFIKDKLEDDVEYTAESVFVGIHLKGTWLNELKWNSNTSNTVEIGMPNTIVLYDLLSGVKVKGLKEKTYIFAKVLRMLAECSKIYQHYDKEADRLYKQIREWNMELSNDDKEIVKKAILEDALETSKEQ